MENRYPGSILQDPPDVLASFGVGEVVVPVGSGHGHQHGYRQARGYFEGWRADPVGVKGVD